MSTKTTFKRIALVAVVALGLGGLSTVSANATAGTVSSLYVSSKSIVKGYAVTAGTITSDSTTANVTFSAASVTDTATDAGKSLWTRAGGFIGTIATVTDTTHVVLNALAKVSSTTEAGYIGTLASTTVANGITTGAISGLTAGAGATAALNLVATGINTSSTAKIMIGSQKISSTPTTSVAADAGILVPFTVPTTAGTYTLTVKYSNGGSYLGTDADEVDTTIALTVTAASDLSTALSTAFMSAATDAADSATATTNAVARSAYKTSGTAISQIQVTLKKADGTADGQAHTINATISGAGFVLVDGNAGTPGTPAVRSMDYTNQAGGKSYIHVAADGTAGTGTVTVKVTNVNTLAVTTLGTFTVTSYSAAAALAVSTTNYTIGKAGGYTTGAAVAARTKTNEAGNPLATDGTNSVPAFVVKTTDSAGNLVNLTDAVGNAAVPTIVSSDTTVITGGTCVKDDGSSLIYSSGAGTGYYNCNFATAVGAVSGGKATLTIRTPNPADRTLYLTTTLNVTVGAKVAKTAIALDSVNYGAGQALNVTLTATDASGNPVYDGATSPTLTSSKSLGGAALGNFTGYYVGGIDALATSVAKSTSYAPSVGGEFIITGTDSALNVITAKGSVTTVGDTAANAATDAANEATDAANAATDAALAAADAADAATAAAQDASDAVAALSATVATLVASLKAQITSLTNLVIKIQKKVKA